MARRSTSTSTMPAVEVLRLVTIVITGFRSQGLIFINQFTLTSVISLVTCKCRFTSSNEYSFQFKCILFTIKLGIIVSSTKSSLSKLKTIVIFRRDLNVRVLLVYAQESYSNTLSGILLTY